MSKSEKLHKPGEPAPKSGIYEMTGPRGGSTGEQKVSTEGNPLPPTDKPGQKYRLFEEAKHTGKKPD